MHVTGAVTLNLHPKTLKPQHQDIGVAPEPEPKTLKDNKRFRALETQIQVLVPGSLFIGYLLFPLQGFVWQLTQQCLWFSAVQGFGFRVPSRLLSWSTEFSA